MGENGRLTTRQRRFLVALLASPTVRDAAALAGIGENTAYRYLRDDALRRALHEAQDAMLSEAARWALQRVLVALDVLAGIATDPGLPAGSRVSAARAILENALRFTEAVDLVARIEALEQKLEARDGH